MERIKHNLIKMNSWGTLKGDTDLKSNKRGEFKWDLTCITFERIIKYYGEFFMLNPYYDIKVFNIIGVLDFNRCRFLKY